MPPLRRHQLAHLGRSGWRRILDQDWDVEAAACLRHWADHGLPLVVTRQRTSRLSAESPVALGLAAPACWGRRALALQAAAADIAFFSEFPQLAAVRSLLPRGDRAALQVLDEALQQLGVRVHVYGSAGWQQISGLDCLHEGSDLDLWLAVDGLRQTDAAVRLLGQCATRLRVDGELMFADGSAVAWREWAAWRQGRCGRVLVKRLHGAALEEQPGSLPADWACAA